MQLVPHGQVEKAQSLHFAHSGLVFQHLVDAIQLFSADQTAYFPVVNQVVYIVEEVLGHDVGFVQQEHDLVRRCGGQEHDLEKVGPGISFVWGNT